MLSLAPLWCAAGHAPSLRIESKSGMPISDTSKLGTNVKIFHPDQVNLYGCTIGDDSRVGSFVEIQKNATIGARCKISSHSFICEGVIIEDEVFIGHGVMFTNDRLPRATNPDGSPMTEEDWKLEFTQREAPSLDRHERYHFARRHDRRICISWRGCRRDEECARFRNRGRSTRKDRRGHQARIKFCRCERFLNGERQIFRLEILSTALLQLTQRIINQLSYGRPEASDQHRRNRLRILGP